MIVDSNGKSEACCRVDEEGLHEVGWGELDGRLERFGGFLRTTPHERDKSVAMGTMEV